MRKFLALLLLVAVVYADGSFSPQFPGVLNYQYTVNYTISGSSITFSGRLSYTSFVWLGVGWQPINSTILDMTGGDFQPVLFNNDGTLQSIIDSYCACPTGGGPPSQDTVFGGVNNVVSTSGSQFLDAAGNHITTYQFTKPLNTGDSFDNILAVGQTTTFLFAIGSSNAFGFHQSAVPYPGVTLTN